MSTPAAAPWCRFDAARGCATLTLHVQPNARRTAVAGRHGDALKVHLAAPPADDRANRALIDHLRQRLDVAVAQVTIRRGSRSRRKIVEITRCDAQTVARIARLESA